MGVFRYKITLFFSTSGRNIKPTARGNPRISISYHGNVTPYFMHIGMVSDDRGMGIRGEWIISYLKNLKLFSIRVKELSEPIVL